MLLQEFKEQGLLLNTNFLSDASETGVVGYRGDLVLSEGEPADEKGHSKPSSDVLRGAVLLEQEGKLACIIGSLDDVNSITLLADKYASDFSKDMKALLFVVNIPEPMQVELAGINFILLPLVQGVPWNEVIEELGLEKSDFKGQSAADKIVTVYKELQDYRAKANTLGIEEALASATDLKRETWGAV